MQTIVGVLRGGPSREHEISLKTGAAILAALPPERFTARDIYIDKTGQWYERGRTITPERILQQIDLALIGLHGEFGEDGGVQKLLERYGVPYAGSDSFASYFAMHKVLAKEKMQEVGLRIAQYKYIQDAREAASVAAELTRTFPQPVVIKPVAWGSSVGVSIVAGYAPILAAIEHLFTEGAQGVLAEEYIRGTEATAGVIENFRSEKLYALPPVEILPPEGDFFSYDSKYSGVSREIVPGRFPRKVSEELMRSARLAHQTLGLRHYSRSDFIISPRGVYYLESNTLPGLTSESLLPKSLAAVGIAFPDFLSHLAALALG